MNIVILQSCASGKSVRINMNGQVEGVGGSGYYAQFRVHVRRPGVVALQNVHNSQNWIAIHQGRTIGTVREIASIYRASTKRRAQGKPLLTSILLYQVLLELNYVLEANPTPVTFSPSHYIPCYTVT